MAKKALKPKIVKAPKVIEVLNTSGHLIRGRVVSVKTLMTVVVLVERRVMHPMYKKTYRRSKKYLVHDELGVKLGDIVDIVKIKPMSRNKHFKILKVAGQDMEAIVTEQLKADAAQAIAQVMPIEPEVEELTPEVSQEKQTPKAEKTSKVKGEK